MLMQEETNGPTVPYDFCDFYRFEGDKVAELTAFVIRTDKSSASDRAANESGQTATATARHG
jgi:hypothetical protein